MLEQEAERRKHRRSTDDVWLADDDDSAKNVDVEGSFSGAPLHVSEEHQECSVCFEPLCKERTAVFVNEEGVRTCGHFLHERCARSVVEASGCCPICRTECARRGGTVPDRGRG